MTDPTPAQAVEAPEPTGIVVGVDGSDHGYCALVWAAREAQSRKRPLHLITAYSVPIFAASGLDGGFATIDDEVIRQGAVEVLEQATARLAGYDVEFDTRVERGDASSVLMEASQTAELLVFGSRGRGGFVGRLLGSVSSALPGHAKCPTVTVPLNCAPRLGEAAQPDAAPQVEAVVTVGVDGSEQARYAVLVAAEQAQRSGLALRVICAVPPYTGAMAWLPAPLDRQALFEDIKVQLSAGVAWLTSHFPSLPITADVLDGPPVEVLVGASKVSELVVLGTRGHGGFAGMILGSTTDGTLHHAKGPVMVVRDHEDPRLADRSSFGPMLGNV
ncbi:universal stress protein [Arthrobacter russicus]|jgi:nucleotide-binding universal stress UspA family protein|uniref:Nucleotide-binding universal stress UspA family protein n=1 Tax=Arthrobacter russicus TaxID=172040 RepID=A0ABU1JAS3_9MICC|nr:universal stress protein [Arthrobacter russicus]MDN5668831.1 universal stress protein [Renibacterium salmoninarum]MDR6269524.1 nucleotide-binding universal stress UspA family protein [Arthrobacter russicus]